MRPDTVAARRRLYLLARVVVVARHYRRELTLGDGGRRGVELAAQVQRAYAQFGDRASRGSARAAHGCGGTSC